MRIEYDQILRQSLGEEGGCYEPKGDMIILTPNAGLEDFSHEVMERLNSLLGLNLPHDSIIEGGQLMTESWQEYFMKE